MGDWDCGLARRLAHWAGACNRRLGGGRRDEHPWNDRSLPASARAQMALDRMTDEEKLRWFTA